MLKGIATVNVYAEDLDAARAWYAEVFGIDAYYQVPGYVEFRVGTREDEFGIIDARYAPPRADIASGAIVHWAVDDLDAELSRVLGLGAQPHLPIIKHGDGDGFVTASVVDPFGNLLGLMKNEHFDGLAE